MGPQAKNPVYRSTGRFLVEGIEGLVVSTFVVLSWFISRRWLANLGALESERTRRWPGDRLVSDPAIVFTRAIDIDAPREAVWRWLACATDLYG